MCRACGVEKTGSEFDPEPRNRDGLQARCRECERERKRELRARKRREDPEAARAKARATYAANVEHYREYARNQARSPRGIERDKAWRSANPDKVAETQRRHRSKPEVREKTRRRSRAKYAVDPANILANGQRRRAHKSNAPGAGITADQWKQILSDWGHRCAYCMVESKHAKLSMDHVEPLCTGGAHDESNIVPACKSCNSSKRDRTFDELVESPHSLVTQRLMAWL